jgi:Zn-dependent protease
MRYLDEPVLRFHWSWLLMMAIMAFVDAPIFFAFMFIFCFVVLHEFGHLIAAEWCKVTSGGILVLPFGGLATVLIPPQEYKKEFVIAIAGPLVNLFFYGLFTLLGVLIAEPTTLVVLELLAQLNLILFAFNLVPCLPMDGGRILRSSLGLFLSMETRQYISIFLSYVVGTAALFFAVIVGWWVLAVLFMFVLLLLSAEEDFTGRYIKTCSELEKDFVGNEQEVRQELLFKMTR